MRLVAICPTYRKQRCVREAYFHFLQQKYKDKFLYILDDSDCFYPFSNDSVYLEVTDKRFPSLPEKYRFMAKKAVYEFGADGIVLWEDDDIYLPNHLEVYAQCLSKGVFVRPSLVYMTTNSKELITHKVSFNFHASTAFSKSFVEEDLLWPMTDAPNYDTQFLIAAYKKHRTVDVLKVCNFPTYCFYWINGEYHGETTAKYKQEWYRIWETLTKPCEKAVLTPTIGERTKHILDLIADHQQNKITLPAKILK